MEDDAQDDENRITVSYFKRAEQIFEQDSEVETVCVCVCECVSECVRGRVCVRVSE